MKKKKILIADDSKTFILFEELLLSSLICTTLRAYNGLEALQKARSESPDLILLDIHMPQMNGIEVCRVLKNDKATKHIPIIIVTAHANEINECIKAGCEEVITKPIEKKALLSIVKKYI
jgi:CheY-like chemotaxis protein